MKLLPLLQHLGSSHFYTRRLGPIAPVVYNSGGHSEITAILSSQIVQTFKIILNIPSGSQKWSLVPSLSPTLEILDTVGPQQYPEGYLGYRIQTENWQPVTETTEIAPDLKLLVLDHMGNVKLSK